MGSFHLTMLTVRSVRRRASLSGSHFRMLRRARPIAHSDRRTSEVARVSEPWLVACDANDVSGFDADARRRRSEEAATLAASLFERVHMDCDCVPLRPPHETLEHMGMKQLARSAVDEARRHPKADLYGHSAAPSESRGRRRPPDEPYAGLSNSPGNPRGRVFASRNP